MLLKNRFPLFLCFPSGNEMIGQTSKLSTEGRTALAMAVFMVAGMGLDFEP